MLGSYKQTKIDCRVEFPPKKDLWILIWLQCGHWTKNIKTNAKLIPLFQPCIKTCMTSKIIGTQIMGQCAFDQLYYR